MVFINFAQSLACFVVAGLYLLLSGGFRGESAPVLRYWKVGISNTIGPALGIVALKNIRWDTENCFPRCARSSRPSAERRPCRRHCSYTAQVLAKSCKTIPVMLTGVVLYGKRYKGVEYLSAVLIAGTPSPPLRIPPHPPPPGLRASVPSVPLRLTGRRPLSRSWHLPLRHREGL